MMRLAGLPLLSHSVTRMQVAHTSPVTRTHPLNRSYGPLGTVEAYVLEG